MTAKKRIVFVVNPISGTQGKKAILKWIDERIDRALFDYSIVKTQYAGHAVEIAAAAAKDNVDIVVAIGGDGTINEIGRSLVHTNTALGIIPCGSGNGLARHLHIPMDAKAAIDLLNTGECTCVDYGKINDMPFFCTCGVGFDAFVSLKFADSGKRGLLTYLENTLHESLTYEPETYEIENEEGTIKYKAFLIACANASQYGNNAYIAPQASLTDGLMDVTILEPFTVLDVPSLSFQLFNKTIDQNSRIKTMRAKKIKIHRTKEGVMHYDGDPRYTSPYKFYQFWLNVSDEDAARYIKIFTSLSQEEVEALTAEHAEAPHLRVLQKRLAKEVTVMVHSEEDYNAAVEASGILFGNATSEALKKLDEDTLLAVFEGVPQFEVSRDALAEGVKAVDLFVDNAAVFASKGEMRKLVQGGGVSLNKEKLNAFDQVITAADLLDEKYLLVQRGKKNYYLVIAK